jgi:adenylate cyclase
VSTPAKVMVVDDTPHNVKLLADLLGVKGYAVATATSGEEALAKLPIEKPDLVLLDVMMPGLSGYEVCQRIRANSETALLPVVMVTSLDPQGERVKGIEAGADDFLAKPINQPELFARVRSLLRVKALQDEVVLQAKSRFSRRTAGTSATSSSICVASPRSSIRPSRKKSRTCFATTTPRWARS